jgi:hypothetical protein
MLPLVLSLSVNVCATELLGRDEALQASRTAKASVGFLISANLRPNPADLKITVANRRSVRIATAAHPRRAPPRSPRPTRHLPAGQGKGV